MTFPVLPADVIRAKVSLGNLVEPVAEALMAFSRGEAGPPAVSLLTLPAPGEAHVKSAFLARSALFAVKVATSFPGNADRGLSPFDGLMLAFDAATGHVVAALHDESYLTDLRTAAVLGTGVQARLQVQALHAERPFGELLVWGRDEARAQVVKADLAPLLTGVRIEVRTDRREVVQRSDVLITATASRSPLVEGAWLRPGQHVTAIGGDNVGKVELGASALRRADRLIVDSRELNVRLGDVHAAVSHGGLSPSDVHGELGEVLSGTIQVERGPTTSRSPSSSVSACKTSLPSRSRCASWAIRKFASPSSPRSGEPVMGPVSCLHAVRR